MKLFVATALLLCVVADAYHTSEHRLLGPLFRLGKTHIYDMTMEVSSSVAGLSAQASRSVLKAELMIYAKTESEHYLKMRNVKVSGSLKGVSSESAHVELKSSKDLEDYLSIPIKFIMERGRVTSYSLGNQETIESKKIKRSILRLIQLHMDEEAVAKASSHDDFPITYNVTRESPVGPYKSNYVITVSPDPEFPYNMNVFNISRSDDYEGIRYPGYEYHHNFDQQGCPEACKVKWSNNKYGAGCPVGHEPHQSIIKLYYSHHHNLAMEKGVMVPEMIESHETHVANTYDQDIKVDMRSYIIKKNTNSQPIEEPSGQTMYSDLDDLKKEESEKEINEFCGYESSRKAAEVAKKHLNDLAEIVAKADLDDQRTTIIGEKMVLLQKALAMLMVSDLEAIEETIPKLGTLQQARDTEKIKRQIWMDILSVIGTEQSVAFISKYLLNKVPAEVTVWEAKELLEALPVNIHKPSEKIIRNLMKIWSSDEVKDHHMYHSASHLVVARLISRICGESQVIWPSVEEKPSSWMSDYRKVLKSLKLSENEESSVPASCPMPLVKEIVSTIRQKLSSAHHKQRKAIYIETLSHIGTLEALQHLASYAYGIDKDIINYSPGQNVFFRTLTIYTLHNVVWRYPGQVLKIVTPIYLNKTEEPKVRTAAFSVILKAQPSLALLHHIVHDTWFEPSNEVGSYVTSSLETFGNSSLPCYQLTAHRIKKVISLAKRFDIGNQHAKHILSTYFDETRDFGFEYKFGYTPSNESYIPSTMYQALSYSSDSLKDIIFQMALQIQGLTQKMLVEKLRYDILNIRTGKTIPSDVEREIFGKASVRDRVPEEFKMVIFRRLFYSSSYYYFDNLERDLAPFRTHWNKYFKTPSGVKGTYVKLFMPSSHHTRAIGKTVPLPVEFEMKNPILVAVRVKSLSRGKISPQNMQLAINLSVYMSKMYNNHVKVLRDCKETGSYYEQKLCVVIPFEVKLFFRHLGKIELKYKITELPKSIVTALSEAGTYAGKKDLETLPHMKERRPIKTVPEQFKQEGQWSIVGLPVIRVSYHSDIMHEGTEDIPSNAWEAVHWLVTRAHNAGWRRKSLNVTLSTDRSFWPENTEVTVDFDYERSHIVPTKPTGQQVSMNYEDREQSAPNNEWSHVQASEKVESEEDLVKEIEVKDDINSHDAPKFIRTGKTMFRKMVTSVPHVAHVIDIRVKTTPINNEASLRAEYNHTLGKLLHVFHMDADINLKRIRFPFQVSADHMIGYVGVPNQFKYDEKMSKLSRGYFLSTMSLHNTAPFENVDVMIIGNMRRKPVSEILNKHLVVAMDAEHARPASHEECLRHMNNGRALSDACMRSLREISTFNNYKAVVTWSKAEVPSILGTVARRIELATRAAYLGHVEIEEKKNEENAVNIELTYIDKFIDEPVVDIVLEKPTQTVRYLKVNPGPIQPLSSLYTVRDTYIRAATNYTYPATCRVMEKHIATYDLKTYELPAHKCQYILSAHCTEFKQFAVLAKVISPHDGTKEITIQVADQKVILKPKDREGYKVLFNGKEYIVQVWEPLSLGDDETKIYVVKNTAVDESFLEVYAPIIGLKVIYDGRNAKIQVHPRYKGELCGLCSEFDGEITREYVAPDQCLYSHVDDFVKRSIVNPEECSVDPAPAHKYLCQAKGGYHQAEENEDDDETDSDDSSSMQRRNIVKYRGEDVCFSVLPVPWCRDQAEPKETEERQVGFHCLPRRDKTAKKLVNEAKYKVLDVMRNKSVDWTETEEVAKRC